MRYVPGVNGDPNQMQRFHDELRQYGERGGFHHGDHRWLMLLFFVVLLAALGLIAVSAARWAFGHRPAGSVALADDALSLLRLRYARGEIGRDDFLLAHGDLGGGSPPADAHPA